MSVAVEDVAGSGTELLPGAGDVRVLVGCERSGVGDEVEIVGPNWKGCTKLVGQRAEVIGAASDSDGTYYVRSGSTYTSFSPPNLRRVPAEPDTGPLASSDVRAETADVIVKAGGLRVYGWMNAFGDVLNGVGWSEGDTERADPEAGN